MKKIKATIKTSFFIILSLTNITLYAQQGCKYNGNFNAILSEVKSRNNNAPTQEDKLTDTEAKKVAKYWELDCKCRNGVSSQQEAQSLANEAFLNTSNNFYKGMGVNQKKKDISYLGDLKTPFAVFTPNECLNGGGGGSFGSSFESNVNCVPEASRIEQLDGQLAAYAGTFFMAYCKCKQGVSSQEEANALIAQMKTNYKNFNEVRNNATPPLSTQPLTSCNITSESGSYGGSSGLISTGDTKKLVKDEWMGLLNGLAENSENETFKEMVGTMNEVKSKVSQMQDYANMIAPGFIDQSFFNTMENVGTGIAIFGAGVEMIDALFGKKEVQYTESQINAYQMYDKISLALLMLYDEINAVPTYYEYNQITLDKLAKREKLISEYNINTAKQRLLCIRYLLKSDKAMNTEELQSIVNQIDNLSDREAIIQIQELVENIKNSKNLPVHLYSDKQFTKANGTIYLTKALCYEKMGNTVEADKYREKYNTTAKLNTNIEDLATSSKIMLITLGSFEGLDYDSTSKYGNLIFDYFKEIKKENLIYPDLGGNSRGAISMIMAMAIISDIKINELSQAKIHLSELIRFHQSFENYSPKKKETEVFREQLQFSSAMVDVARAYILSAENKHEQALTEINKAMIKVLNDKETPISSSCPDWLKIQIDGAYYKYNDMEFSIGKCPDWFNHLKYIKLEILFAKGDYENAKEELKELVYREYPNENIHFTGAYIRYQTGDYNGALIATNILEKKFPNNPKVYALKEKICLKLNRPDEAKDSRNKYVELINKK